ncbi:protein expanded [Chrysoperla carnea]|uniref:protein expanded n=1 Tax=Chrysoperla carnea TaxID=189513 RepID=UPI001D0769BC|nr:protein expanded [Chrysoperla carnea]
MRGAGLCTVSAPLAACSLPPNGAASLPPSARFLALHLLTNSTDLSASGSSTTTQQTLYFIVEAKSRVKEVYSQTCLHFSQQGMLDTDLFGLALICDGEYLFAEPESKLSKYAPKSWRSSHTHGLDANGRPALAFYFRVQFYVDSPLLLRDETTRHHYYLQVRENAASRTGAAVIAPDHALMLAGLALQADLGDRSDNIQPGYFRPEDYVPPALRTPWGIQTIESHHRQNRGLTRTEAEMQYIQEVCHLQEPINAHVFRLRASKQESLPGSILLAVYAHGVKVYPDNNPASTFLWGSIGKLSFERKKFEIRTGHEKLTLYTTCDEKSKLLLGLCRDTHQFSMAMAPRLNEARKEVEKQRICFRDFYSYSRIPRQSARPDQRISVISNTSSNTTSGIVSDRVHSEDELEILITCPPAQSTESLALAHLMDSNLSRQSSSRSSINRIIDKPLTSLANTIEAMASLKLSSNHLSSSSSSLASDTNLGYKGTSEDQTNLNISQKSNNKFAGSQCSSSCSTVVVSGARKLNRRTSTTSSLELGYSHTAQNSAISDATCFELDVPENSSGVFTTCSKDNSASSQTSGIHTIESSFIGDSEPAESTTNIEEPIRPNRDLTNIGAFTQSSADIDQPDSATNAFRDRSNSNLSSTGSFRGDGSDPTEKKQALSAEELSNLIVGKGVYPSHQTVSHTLDSDSDYVTISSSCQGFPPIPPKRTDSHKLTTPGYSLVDNIQTESIKKRLSDPPPYNARHENINWYTFNSPNHSFFGDIGDPPIAFSNDVPIPTLPSRGPPPYPYGASEIPIPMYPRAMYSPEKLALARNLNNQIPIDALTSISSPAMSTCSLPIPPPIPPKHPTMSLPPSKSHDSLKFVTTQNKYVDLTANKSSLLLPYTFLPPPPPPQVPRQPPPPPPGIATVYTKQLSQSQIEQYQQQMHSDVDFVVFPLKEPAISKQEYLDAKHGSLIASLAHNVQPRSKPLIYRSTPYLNLPVQNTSRYASSQNLTDMLNQSILSMGTSVSSTSDVSNLDHPSSSFHQNSNLKRYSLILSEDNLLSPTNTLQKAQYRAAIPPPRPPSLPKKMKEKVMSKSTEIISEVPTAQTTLKSKTNQSGGVIDIRTLREKSKNLDLPLISALCNDRSLLKQTKAFVMPKHPRSDSSPKVPLNAAKLKYPVSGLSNTQITTKMSRKSLASHRHPSDKLPEIPRAAPNNYVVNEPRAKHKSSIQSRSQEITQLGS